MGEEPWQFITDLRASQAVPTENEINQISVFKPAAPDSKRQTYKGWLLCQLFHKSLRTLSPGLEATTSEPRNQPIAALRDIRNGVREILASKDAIVRSSN